MHPSRLVAICFVAVSVLLLAQIGIVGGRPFTAGAVLQGIGGVVLLLAGLYGVVRYEENPIVDEYGPTTYLLVFGLVIWQSDC
ncbi:hypothetical protein FK85_22095 [Halorubrum saccharovorum]|uniref:Uncharacterized protein n=1 Tax=Halorubrum saccharovorum TaxID=2248 RepID=A0A081ERQ5_9EURY|nr:hypothetical protein [Halorubrum saccharovorum]KDS90093.2 hypothetical protein FK85_22095 [Halorubrum saccharovorum]